MEVWKDVVGYEGLYKISEYGKVKSLARIDNNNHFIRERILKTGKNSGGYSHVVLSKNGVTKCCKVHRLVAEAFIGKCPDEMSQVNHIDEDKTNNHFTNLEWCTPKYNTNYGTSLQRRIESRRTSEDCQAVRQYSLEGDFIAEYISHSDASRKTGIHQGSISRAVRKKLTAGGYIWRNAT